VKEAQTEISPGPYGAFDLKYYKNILIYTTNNVVVFESVQVTPIDKHLFCFKLQLSKINFIYKRCDISLDVHLQLMSGYLGICVNPYRKFSTNHCKHYSCAYELFCSFKGPRETQRIDIPMFICYTSTRR
jgi:hypothetical protein